jgi:hypothetical protein
MKKPMPDDFLLDYLPANVAIKPAIGIFYIYFEGKIVLILTMDKPFEREEIYDAPVQKVWQALTDEAQMKAWYFQQLQHFKPVAGFEFVFINDSSAYQKEWKVTKVIPSWLLAHSWTYKNYPATQRSLSNYSMKIKGGFELFS